LLRRIFRGINIMFLIKQANAAACTPYVVGNANCKCDPTSTTDECLGATSLSWCNSVDVGVTNTCTAAAVCAASDTAVISTGCACKTGAVANADPICAAGSYCINTAGTTFICSLYSKANIPTCITAQSYDVAANEVCKCVQTSGGSATAYCITGEKCDAPTAGTCTAITAAATGTLRAGVDGNTADTADNKECTDSANTVAFSQWDVIANAASTQYCTTTTNTKFQGTPVYTSGQNAANTVDQTTSTCTLFKANGPNTVCKSASAASWCGGGTYYAADDADEAVACLKLGAAVSTLTICKNDGSATNGQACACKRTAGRDTATMANMKATVTDGDRACAAGKYCGAQREGYTFQGIPTCSTAQPGMCHLITASNGPVAGNNGTVFTAAHASGVGTACFCGDKICGAGRACIAANTTGWSGVKADGAEGATGFAASSQCLSAQIDHCPGGNGTVQHTVATALTNHAVLFSDSATSNKACYCDTAESKICGAGRFCLNNTASGFTGSAECLSSHAVHCTNSSGTTSADEACYCSSSLTCAQGQFCVNGTWFQDDANAAECLAAEISACLNDTLGDGANTAACTCGDKVCGAGQFCDSNTTCADAGTAVDDEEAGSLAKPMGAVVAVLATLAALFASFAL